ncbi:MAG: YfhO family protein [Opitutales bacterium]|nr:YfhO family protein [Opitutales bacterium]
MIFVIWLLLFFGRTTWGSAVDLLPFSQNIHMHRFIGGVHLGGIFLAAAALAVPLRWAVTRGNKWYIAAVLLLTLLLLAPVYVERRTYLSDNAAAKQENQAGLKAEQADMDNVIKTLQALPPGRIYAGLSTKSGEERWGFQYKIGPVPVAFILGAAGLDIFSSTLHGYSLVSHALEPFDESSPHHYNLFNIRYVVFPENSQVPDFMKPVEQFGRHKIFKVETTGYFDLVGSRLVLDGNKEAYGSGVKAWLTSGFPEAKSHPLVSIDGSPKIRNEGTRNRTVLLENLGSTDRSLESVSDLNSYITQASNNPTRGSVISEDLGTNFYSTKVNVDRESMLMLKVAYHPNWRATVDGVDTETFMLMPGFPAIQLGPGEHDVMMEYQSRSLRNVLLGFGFLALVFIGILEQWGTTVSASLKSSVLVSVLSSMKLRDNRSGSRSGRRRRSRRNR